MRVIEYLGDDVCYHTNVTAKPKMNLALRRDRSGKISGPTLKLLGLGDIPFVKVSDTPVYQPLPADVLPDPAEEAGGRSGNGR